MRAWRLVSAVKAPSVLPRPPLSAGPPASLQTVHRPSAPFSVLAAASSSSSGKAATRNRTKQADEQHSSTTSPSGETTHATGPKPAHSKRSSTSVPSPTTSTATDTNPAEGAKGSKAESDVTNKVNRQLARRRPVVVRGALREWVLKERGTPNPFQQEPRDLLPWNEVLLLIGAYVRRNELRLDGAPLVFRCNEELKKLLGADRMAYARLKKVLADYVVEPEGAGPEYEFRARKMVEQMETNLREEALEGIARRKRLERLRKGKWTQERKDLQREAGTGVWRSYKLSPELHGVVGGDGIMNRFDLTKRLWKYVKDNGLQDRTDGRKVVCDEKLKRVFGNRTVLDFFRDVQRELNRHLTKL